MRKQFPGSERISIGCLKYNDENPESKRTVELVGLSLIEKTEHEFWYPLCSTFLIMGFREQWNVKPG